MYDLTSKFDIEQHKKHYVNYLEVVLFPDGHIEYAVPSHQEKLIAICKEKYGITRQQLYDLCPREYFFDVMTWLCNMSGCVSIWSDYVVASDTVPMTVEQTATMHQLIEGGLLTIKA